MKWIGIIMVVVAINGYGFCFAARYRKRCCFWKQMEMLAARMASEISYTRDPPKKILDRLSKLEEFSGLYVEDLSAFAAQKSGELNYKEDQLQAVTAFFRDLGATDLEGQLTLCQGSAQRFREQHEQACAEQKNKGKLYRGLCFLASLAVAVLSI